MIQAFRLYVRQAVRAALPLMPLVLVAAFAALLLSPLGGPIGGFVLASPLFQSPVSPVDPDLPMELGPSPEEIATIEAEQRQAEPQPQPPAAAEPTPAAPEPAAPAPQPAAPAPAEAPTTAPAAPPPAAEPVEPAQPPLTPVAPAGEEGGDNEVVIDSGLLIDSILVYFSYAWLCCGVLAFIFIPILFLVLYVWGSRRNKANGQV